MDYARGETRVYLSKAKQQDPTVVSAAAVGHTAIAEPLPAPPTATTTAKSASADKIEVCIYVWKYTSSYMAMLTECLFSLYLIVYNVFTCLTS